MLSLLLVCLTLLITKSSCIEYTNEALADQIKDLPGADNLEFNFNQFSGYLKVSDTKNLHYWLVESQNDPVNDPLAFWTNGGPGCSGMIGFLTEQGPFRPNKDMSLSLNPYAWNKIANMVFIEAPCGVGFSYSDNKDDYTTDDDQTAIDNYVLIQEFLNRFPQFRQNKLYLTSESYGGHYMPTLSKEIVDMNAKPDNTYPKLNFKGFAVGNPATDVASTFGASVATFWGHQLISKPLWDRYNNECLHATGRRNWEECEFIVLDMYKQIGNLNHYALDYPVCTEDSPAKYGRSQRNWLMNHMLNGWASRELQNGNKESVNNIDAIRKAIKLEPIEGYEPCEDNYMVTYLNQPSVKAAIHVNADIDWQDCSRTIRYKETDSFKSMTSYYNYLLDGNYGLDILVYSGDDDDVCATVGTQSWIWDLGYNVSATNNWNAYTVNEQTAGYLTQWKDVQLGFATVHGAGHEVPTYKPQEAFYLWQNYLKGELTRN